jgi:hypothetical protein
MFVGKHGVLLGGKRLGGGQGGGGFGIKRRSSIYSNYGKGLRNARKGANVGKQEGKICVDVGGELGMRGVVRTWIRGGRTVCNVVVRDGKIPEDWSRSWMVNVYKGKEMPWHAARTWSLSC